MRFLVGVFKRYPHLAGRDFWVSGESYGGHYVPNLASAVLDYNAQAADADKIALKARLGWQSDPSPPDLEPLNPYPQLLNPFRVSWLATRGLTQRLTMVARLTFGTRTRLCPTLRTTASSRTATCRTWGRSRPQLHLRRLWARLSAMTT